MNLMARRRGLMAGGWPVIPEGYNTDGLVFFLDCKQLISGSSWIDVIGRKRFELVNCQITDNGVVFDGTGYGFYDGTITSNWESETIEIVADLPQFTSGSDVTAIFCQPVISETMGIGLRFGYNGYIRTAVAQDGVQRTRFEWLQQAGLNRIGVNASRLVVNGTNQTRTSRASYGANTSGRSFIGARATTDPVTTYNRFIGTIQSIRIYNRILSLSELQQNQANDLSYYKLT